MSAKVLLKSALLFVSLVALGVVLKTTGLGAILDEGWIDANIRGQGASGRITFVAVAGLAASLGLPRQLVSFLGGYAFGFVEGAALALTASATGCVIAFTYARVLGRDLVASRFSGRIERIDAFLADNPFSMTVLIRFLPLGSNLATNLAAGVSSVSAVAFVAGSAVGYIPQTVVFALVGSGITLEPALRISVAALLFACSGAIGVHLYRKHRHGKSLDDALERDLADAPAGAATERQTAAGDGPA